MKTMKKRTGYYFVLMICLFTVLFVGNAEAVEYNLGQVLVSATKMEQYQSQMGTTTTVINSEDIEKSGKKTVAGLIQSVPGVSVARSGGLGGATAIYLRGAKPGQTLVLIDGVEVNDPSSVDKSFDFAHLNTDNLERIEIVRGPQSTLYGSDAIGGVINIITKRGKGKNKTSAAMEIGSYNTLHEEVSMSGSFEKVNFSFAAGRTDSDGISKAKDGIEKDGYANTTLSSSLGWEISDEARISMVNRYSDMKTDLDSAAYTDDPNYRSMFEQFNSRIALSQQFDPRWDYCASFSFTDIERKLCNFADALNATVIDSVYSGDIKKFELQNNISFFDNDIQTFGVELNEGRATFDSKGTFPSRIDQKTADNKGYYFQSQWEINDNFSTIFGARIDDDERFDPYDTYKVSAVYSLLPINARVKSSWGTGFKAPSLYQLFSSYGSPDLKPDESIGYDFGFEQEIVEGKLYWDATYFYNSFKNMVDFDLGSYLYKNIGRAKTNGIEIGTRLNLKENLFLAGNYTYMKTQDKDTGLKLARRPENEFSLNADWKFSDEADLNIVVNYAGARFSNQTNTLKLKQYATVDAALSYDLKNNVQFFSRIENLFNKTYQEVAGYNMLGRTLYAGIKGEF